jgi:glycosyltransferase involved in cell wall biosynthesis
MKLSVIIPFLNELNLINRAINSALINSTFFSELEIILINDGLYKENEIRDCFENNVSTYVKIIKNRYAKSCAGSRNTGLDESNGDIIAFLDADDVWLPGKLEAQMQEINKGATFVVTSYLFEETKVRIKPPRSIDKSLDIFLKRGIGASTVVITRELLENHRFKIIKNAQDIDLWFRLAQSKKFKYAQISKEFVEYSTQGNTKNKLKQLYYLNLVLRINKIDIFSRIKINISYGLNGILNFYLKPIIMRIKKLLKTLLHLVSTK